MENFLYCFYYFIQFFLIYLSFGAIIAVFFYDFAIVSKKRYFIGVFISLLVMSLVRLGSILLLDSYIVASVISLLLTILVAVVALNHYVKVPGSMVFYALCLTLEYACFITGNNDFNTYYFGSLPYYVWLYVGSLLFFSSIICIIIRKFITPLYHRWKERRTWMLLSISPLLGAVGFYYLSHADPDFYKHYTISTYIAYWLIFAGLMAANSICAASVNHSIQTTQYQETLKSTNNLLSLQKEQYTNMAELLTKTAEVRHNFRHQANAMNNLIQAGRIDELKEYLSQYINDIPQKNITTGNAVADAVFGHYLAMADEAKIPVHYQIELPLDSQMEDTDFTVLIGNCMENAIEASKELKEEERKITVCTRYYGDFLMFIFENRYNGSIKEEGGHYFSFKRNFREEGIGLACVKRIVEQYGGDIDIDYDEKQFDVKIKLRWK